MRIVGISIINLVSGLFFIGSLYVSWFIHDLLRRFVSLSFLSTTILCSSLNCHVTFKFPSALSSRFASIFSYNFSL